VWKKSHNPLIGYQPRYLKVIAQGDYLAYYNEKPSFSQIHNHEVKPNGVFDISKLTNIHLDKKKPTQ
jgi:hypothetical protein